MRLSTLYTKTRRDAPKDETSKNAQLLIKAGYIYKDSAGIYGMLPLGLKVLNKIIDIIRINMDELGGQEISLTTLQREDLWSKTNRWDDKEVDVWFKSKLKNKTDVGFAWTHEEQMTEMMTDYVSSYRDLPKYIYQFQTKLRNETRAKSGIMRTREFIMKDMYSFSKNNDEHDVFYKKVQASYLDIFNKLGIGSDTYLTYASGGAFSKYSHEFQTITDAGEDVIYIDKKNKIAINEEVLTDELLNDLRLNRNDLVKAKAAEVGNIFNLGITKSEPLDLKFTDESGETKFVVMGSYGIGPARIMGVIAETYSDEVGLVWPEQVAPFKVVIVSLGQDPDVTSFADNLYKRLSLNRVEVLYDDRNDSAGAKFADADLLGIPIRLTISKKTLEANSVEYKRRDSKESKLIKIDDIEKVLSNK
jgi:prolyl-tRNA synthetase